ncbi:hypothetical protein P5673_010661, partial [Acropora cervicornis]
KSLVISDTHFSVTMVSPNEDMRALAYDKFKAVGIAACKTNDELGALFCEEYMMDILLMVGSFLITGIARTLTTIDQMITGHASFGALDYIGSNKNVMKPLFTLDGARHFQPTPELFIEGLHILFSEEGSYRKACEIDVFKNFCDFVQDLGTTQ